MHLHATLTSDITLLPHGIIQTQGSHFGRHCLSNGALYGQTQCNLCL